MNCEKYAEYISALTDGELSSAERRELAEHIKECPDCEKRLDQIKALKETLSDMRAETPYDLHELIMEGVKKENAKRRAGIRKRIFGLCAAACLVFAFALVLAPNFSKLYLFGVKGEKSASEAPAMIEESTEADVAFDDAAVFSENASFDTDSLKSEAATAEYALPAAGAAPSAAGSDSGGTETTEKARSYMDGEFSNYIAFYGNAEIPDRFGDKETDYDPVNNRTYIYVANEDYKDAVAAISAAGFVLVDFDFPEPAQDAPRSLILICGDN
ncbi:MAG: zf-HC2 domain-containing protein [Clostridia bacterium]|nr:zf-HC2 domain-containing protein [Clostridia bacterium]